MDPYCAYYKALEEIYAKYKMSNIVNNAISFAILGEKPILQVGIQTG